MTLFPEHKRAAGRGGVMLAAALVLSGCAVTLDDVDEVRASERPVGDVLRLMTDSRACAAGLGLWNRLVGEDRTIEAENGLVDGCTAALRLGGMFSPISTTMYAHGEEWRFYCDTMPKEVYTENSAALVKARKAAGCER